jgi:hypothetical protein
VSAYDTLTEAQQALFNRVHEDAVWSNEPVTASIPRLIGEADAPVEDKAAVAEAFAPGMGAVFLR